MGMVLGKINVEEPAFQVLFNRTATTPYEIRRYGKRFAIETSFGASVGASSPFGALAGYIGVTKAPENEANEPIAMTAPVAMDRDQQQQRMRFILPSKYDDISKIPRPKNADKVTVKEVPPAVGAVHQFNGSFDESHCVTKVCALAAQLVDDGVDLPKGEDGKVLMDKIKHERWGYNPPFTSPALRRNEVWIELTEKQVEELISSQKKDSQN